jgi:large subunit ribosomal protein L9
MAMEVILTQDVKNLGKAGDVVNVKPGYGRNYLIPQGMAVAASRRNVSRLEHEQKRIAKQVEKDRSTSSELADRLNGMTLQFERRVGEDDRLFGSVTARDIADQLAVAGVELDHRKLQLAEPIRALGKYEVEVKLPAGVSATLKFWVVAQDEK